MAASDYINWDYDSLDDWGPDGASGDPLCYHHQIGFTRLVSQTKKAWELDIPGHGVMWIPKKICREMDIANGTVYVHTATWNRIMFGISKKDLDF